MFPRWVQSIAPKSTEVSAAATAGVPGTSQATATATTPASSEPTELIRRTASTGRPGQRACQRRPGCEHRQDAEGGRDALPTAKPEPGRRHVPQEGGEPHAGGHRLGPVHGARQEHGKGSLQGVQDEHQRPQPLPGHPRHVGGPDVAAAPLADVHPPRRPDEEQPERNAPREVAEEHEARGDHRQPRRVWTMTKA